MNIVKHTIGIKTDNTIILVVSLKRLNTVL